jgi:hypothetical protein
LPGEAHRQRDGDRDEVEHVVPGREACLQDEQSVDHRREPLGPNQAATHRCCTGKLVRSNDNSIVASVRPLRTAPAEFLYREQVRTWTARHDLTVVSTVDHPAPGYRGRVGLW